MCNPDVLENANKKVVLLGNEAIARGAIEAGIGFSSAYPGTPSSEMGMTLASVAKKTGFYFEWATNEKVAFEATAGAAYCGVRAMTGMKQFGLNVASDSINAIMYTGVRGGMVFLVADDPQGLSSAQSEEDTRHAARLFNIPTLEPSNPQECKDFTKLAFDISEKYEIPVMVRTTTRVSHGIGTVKLGQIRKPKTTGEFVKDPSRFFNIQPNLQKLHRQILEKLDRIEKDYSKLNKTGGRGTIGILTNGVSYEHLKELGLKNVKLGKIGITHPISRKFVTDFIKGLKTLIVVEELEPVTEEFAARIAKDVNPKLKIHGKDILPRWGEYSPDLIQEALTPILKLKKKSWAEHDRDLKKIKLPTRKAVFCQGCPHRSTFYAVKKVLGNKPVFAGDIGCYVMGVLEPFEMQDFIISMGASAGVAHGISKVSKQKVVIFMGDSTFFHAGMPPIANLEYNDPKPIIIVMDNAITAMTGHQTNPSSGVTAVGEKSPRMPIEDIIRSFGIKNVKVVNAYSQKELQETVAEFAKKDELCAIVARGTCRLLMKRQLRRKGQEFAAFEVDQEKCKGCKTCLLKFACPAIEMDGDKARINPDLCWGCGVCAQVCPVGAIRPKKRKKEVKRS